jgi:hypothetical protein
VRDHKQILDRHIIPRFGNTVLTDVKNRQHWKQDYDWPKQGEEWSSVWGGSEAQWFATILPRIHAFVPTGTILEIAPGFGRWTTYLKKYCEL